MQSFAQRIGLIVPRSIFCEFRDDRKKNNREENCAKAQTQLFRVHASRIENSQTRLNSVCKTFFGFVSSMKSHIGHMSGH